MFFFIFCVLLWSVTNYTVLIMNKLISVEYKLYSVKADGTKELREETSPENPFSFISGFGYTLEAFENEVEPLSKGDTFDFTLTPDLAYGEVEKERVLTLDRSIFQINGHFDNTHIYKGADVPMQNEDGMRLNGHVVDITDENVVMDFNHPLAGETIQYVGKIAESREATKEEIQGFMNYISGGCSCGCGHDHCDCGEDGCDGNHDNNHHCGCGHCH